MWKLLEDEHVELMDEIRPIKLVLVKVSNDSELECQWRTIDSYHSSVSLLSRFSTQQQSSCLCGMKSWAPWSNHFKTCHMMLWHIGTQHTICCCLLWSTGQPWWRSVETWSMVFANSSSPMKNGALQNSCAVYWRYVTSYIVTPSFDLGLDSWTQILKDATLFFSHSTLNLATVIPSMDYIDEYLAMTPLNFAYAVIRQLLLLVKRTLNH